MTGTWHKQVTQMGIHQKQWKSWYQQKAILAWHMQHEWSFMPISQESPVNVVFPAIPLGGEECQNLLMMSWTGENLFLYIFMFCTSVEI